MEKKQVQKQKEKQTQKLRQVEFTAEFIAAHIETKAQHMLLMQNMKQTHVAKNKKLSIGILSKTLAAGHRRTPKSNLPSNLRVLCDHLQLPKARQVEFKARIIATTFAVNSACWATHVQTNAEMHTQK